MAIGVINDFDRFQKIKSAIGKFTGQSDLICTKGQADACKWLVEDAVGNKNNVTKADRGALFFIIVFNKSVDFLTRSEADSLIKFFSRDKNLKPNPDRSSDIKFIVDIVLKNVNCVY